jgi:hypothetical protein
MRPRWAPRESVTPTTVGPVPSPLHWSGRAATDGAGNLRDEESRARLACRRPDRPRTALATVQTIPGTNPPVPSSVGGAWDLAAGQAVGPAGRDDPRHVDFDGGWFTAWPTHVAVPTYPYVDPNGQTVPWRDCDGSCGLSAWSDRCPGMVGQPMATAARPGRAAWRTLGLVAVAVGRLSIVQSVGFWSLSAVNGKPTGVLLVDHNGPAVTSALIRVVALGLGSAALGGRQNRRRSA